MANRQFFGIGFLILVALGSLIGAVWAEEPVTWIDKIDRQWGVERYQQKSLETFGFPVPLGPMEKVRGSWQSKKAEVVSGTLLRTTWQVRNTPVIELFEQLSQAMEREYAQAFSCSDRSCGNASEWASRVYGERLLYGRDEYLRYAAFRTDTGEWLTLFSAARTVDRQYLHLDVITPDP